MRILIKKSNKEEWANTVTHAVGLLLSFLSSPALLWKAFDTGDTSKIIGVSIYGFALIFLYTASTFYHLVRRRKWKNALQIFDHAGVYLLIAGTYTPVSLWLQKDLGGIGILTFVWSIACIGIVYKIFFINRYPVLSIILYLVLGWVILIKIDVLIGEMPFWALVWLFSGGVFYTIGVIFFLLEKIKFSHAIWHLFVLGGSLCHFLLVYYYAVG